MTKILTFYKRNELLIKLLLLFLVATISVGTVIAFVSIKTAERAYVDSYKDSSQLLLSQMNDNYESLNDSMINIIKGVQFNPAVKHYMKDDFTDETKKLNQAIYHMKQQILNTNLLYNNISSNLVILGTNKNIHYQSEGKSLYTPDELLEKEYIKQAHDDPMSTVYHYSTKGYSYATDDKPSLIVVKAIHDLDGVYGYVLMTILESEFSQFYSRLLDPNVNQVWISNREGLIISSNQKQDIGTNIDQKKAQFTKLEAKNVNALSQEKIYSFDYDLYNLVAEKLVAQKMVLYPTVISVSLFIMFLVSLIAFLIIRKATAPIYELTRKIPDVIKGDFSKAVKVRGTSEIKGLLNAYNFMLGGLHNYVNQLLQQEQEKRYLEFQALQLKIQPHFIYNTLTAIKFQVIQNKNQDAVDSLDAFIRLLRNLIGTKDEFISLDEELRNLNDYIHILKIRFGSNIKTTIHQKATTSILVPKLIIQPFVENCYIHAFPNENKLGKIDIFILEQTDTIKIDIIDNGIGFDIHDTSSKTQEQQRFSGIGISNITERLELIYQEKDLLIIESQPNIGTLVSIILPKKIPLNFHKK
ncbi:cache domain-containing sensor histidine kinase [Enterococcus sp.]|uniref:cache domain-containing sensor histidine kinase n=1 Tax=Enterococcus sp. TaxID=35783 RepID=UPI002FCC2282